MGALLSCLDKQAEPEYARVEAVPDGTPKNDDYRIPVYWSPFHAARDMDDHEIVSDSESPMFTEP